MKISMKSVFAALVSLAASAFLASTASAQCLVHTERTACPGKESESYKKCDGKKSCEKKRPASSEAQCMEEAKKGCPNDRFDITASKIVKAKWNGKDLKGEFDGNFCDPKRDDFNKCDKK
jgi:hypothetical protein